MARLRRAPTHFALGPTSANDRGDSACGINGMWHRGVKYTRDRAQVTCAHCRRWLARETATGERKTELSIDVRQGRTGWWLYVLADGQRISGALWSRKSEAEARAAGPALLAHWRHVSIGVYGSEQAAVDAGLEYHGRG